MTEASIKFSLSTPEPMFSLDTQRDTAEGDQHSAAVGMVACLETIRDHAATAYLDAAAILAEIDALPWVDDGMFSHFRDDAPISTYQTMTELVDSLEELVSNVGWVTYWDGESAHFYVAEMELQPGEWTDDIIIHNMGGHYEIADRDSRHNAGPFHNLAAAIIEAEEMMERDGVYPNLWVSDYHGFCELVSIDHLDIDGIRKVGRPDAVTTS